MEEQKGDSKRAEDCHWKSLSWASDNGRAEKCKWQWKSSKVAMEEQ